MKLIVISNSRNLENETQIITRMFEQGLDTLHLRKHKLSTNKMRLFIKAIPEHFHNRIIIHSHHNLARRFKLKGIHLTKTHKRKWLKTWFTIRLIKLTHPHIIITTSFNNIGQLFEHDGHYNYEYVFLSPVFDSLSSRFQSGFTEYSLSSALKKTEYKVIARGGVDEHAIEKAERIGFIGLAFYSSIWKKPDPIAEFDRITANFMERNIKIDQD